MAESICLMNVYGISGWMYELSVPRSYPVWWALDWVPFPAANKDSRRGRRPLGKTRVADSSLAVPL